MTQPAALTHYELPAPVAAMPDLFRDQAIYIASGDYDDTLLGASGAGSAAADVVALQAAVDAAAARAEELGQTITVDGSGNTYYINAGSTKIMDRIYGGNPGSPETRPFYGGVQLFSNVVLRNCVFIPAPMLTLPDDANHIEAMFYTDQEQARGTFQNIGFINCKFEFGSTKWTTVDEIPSYVVGASLSGVDGVFRIDCTYSNSRFDEFETDSNRGRGMFLTNCDNVTIRGDKLDGIAQSLFAWYLYGVELSGGEGASCNEFYDFDLPCWDVTIRNMRFKDSTGQERDVIDFGGGARWLVDGIIAENTGTIFKVYQKPHAHPTYEAFLEADGLPVAEADCGDLVTPEYVTICNIVGKNTGMRADDGVPAVSTQGSVMVGQLRQSDSWEAQGYTNTLAGGLSNLVGVRRVRVSNIQLSGGGGFNANDCDDLGVEHLLLVDTICEDNSSDIFRNAAVKIRQSASGTDINTVTRINGYLRDVTIINSTGGGMFVSAPSNMLVENVKIRGFNSAQSAYARFGLAVRSLGATANAGVVQVGKLDIVGGGSADDVLLHFSAVDPVVDEFRVQKSGIWNLYPTGGAAYLTSSGRVGDRWSMAYEQHKFTDYDSTVATGSSLVLHPAGAVATNYRAFLGGKAEMSADQSAQGANFTRLSLRKFTAGDPSGADVTSLGSVALDDIAYTARSVLPFSGASFLNPDVLVPGDIWNVAFKRADGGTGSSYSGTIYVTLFYVDFTSIGT